MPGILPSDTQVRKVKHKYMEEFSAVLLPRRTSTGWFIDPSRLIQVLSFKYPYLTDSLNVRLWGDGREIGDRHSTFLTLSLLNNELSSLPDILNFYSTIARNSRLNLHHLY